MMKNVLRLLSIALLIFALVLPVSAYGNLYAHPTINELALNYFKTKIKPDDLYLSEATLDGVSNGIDWPKEKGVSWLPGEFTVAEPGEKTLSLWIIDGGFSADEPELYQGMRHFYDPTKPNAAYLTDHEFFAETLGLFFAHFNYAGVYGEADFPHISAVEWAFDKSNANLYSYPYGKMYFTKALLSDDRNNEYYGKAWRSVGETMHLISDMTVPAHVRNDGHGIEATKMGVTVKWDIDPYEDTTNGGTVRTYAVYTPANLNYNQNLPAMMKDMARFTNQHFISQDTNHLYSQPDLSKPASYDGYIHGTSDGFDYRVARYMSAWDSFLDIRAMPNFLSGNPALDDKVLHDQKMILIPTAIRGSAAVLDRFLPRFKVFGSIKTDQVVTTTGPTTQYYLDGEIIFYGNKDEWPEKLTIRNGASIVNSATKQKKVIPVADTVGDNLNEFRYQFKPSEVGAQAGDKVYLEYDLGGYVIRSADIVVPEPYPTPTPTVTCIVTPYPTQGSIDSRCRLYSDYGMTDDADICRYIYRQSWDNYEKQESSPHYSMEQYRICGCCKYNSADARIFQDCSPGEETNSIPTYLSSACGGSIVTPLTTSRTPVSGGVDMFSYCSSTCGCWLTKERDCLNSGGGSSCNQYKTSYNSCLSSCGARLGNDGGPTKDTLQNFRSRFPPPC
ncbi:MAG: hypothetical protein GX651_04135 [Methanomicrobiales archaeon]|nr:hypothetical protein [Methanomicrobiales archaeon]